MMDAHTFSKQFLELFPEKFKLMHERESDGDLEYVYSTEFTDGINGIMKILAEKNNLQLETEFLNVDYTFFVEGNYNMRIAVEHENITKGKRRIYNFKKLINVNSPLKVLICYYKKNQNPEKISAFYKNKFEKYGQINSEFLLLIGEAEMEEKEENDQSGYYVLKIFSK